MDKENNQQQKRFNIGHDVK